MSGTYPPALRSMFKAVPCLVMCMTASTVWWIATYAMLKHPHDHVPRFSYKYPTFKSDPPNSNSTSGTEMIEKEHHSNKCFTSTLIKKHNLPALLANPSSDILIQLIKLSYHVITPFFLLNITNPNLRNSNQLVPSI